MQRVDFFALEPHFLDHLAPIWKALPEDARGDFALNHARAPFTPAILAEHAKKYGITAGTLGSEDRPVVVSANGDMGRAAKAGRSRIALLEHGTGQSFGGDPDRTIARAPSYPGGFNRGAASLFLSPNAHAAGRDRAAYPKARVEIIGCPKLDAAPERSQRPAGHRPVVAVSFHWDCFPGSVAVSGPPVVGAVSRWFEGELVVLRTASGNELTCTPNHPVLTPEGWVAAGELNPGRRLVRRGLGHGVMNRVRPDEQHAPARIEDVARAAQESSAMLAVRVPVAPEDFHGDGRGSDVAVVSADRLLLNDPIDAARAEHLDERALLGIDLNHPLLSGEGAPGEGRFGLRDTAMARAGRGGHADALLSRQPGIAAYRGVTSIDVGPGVLEPVNHRASDDTSALGEFAGRGATAVLVEERRKVGTRPLAPEPGYVSFGPEHAAFAEVLGDLADRPATGYSEALGGLPTGQVLLDELIEVGRRSFEGHVYNLQTTRGWYEANGFIVHNCMVCPETRSGWREWKRILPFLVADGRFEILGHGHPRGIEEFIPHYRANRIEVVRDFADVLRRADVYVNEGSSTLYEAAAAGLKVVVLNPSFFRLQVHHGLRFHDAAHVGPNVRSRNSIDTSLARKTIGAIEETLVDSPAQQANREAALDIMYAYRSGAAARAAEAILDWTGDRVAKAAA
jgi:hypothetical protein